MKSHSVLERYHLLQWWYSELLSRSHRWVGGARLQLALTGATGIRLCKSRHLRMKAAHLLCSSSSLLPRRGWWVQDTCPVAGRRHNKVHSEHTTIVNSSPAMLFYLTCCINHSVFDTHFRGKYFTGYLHAHGVMTYFKHLQQQQDMQRF